MTQDLFRGDGYLRECTATVQAVTPQGIVLDRTVFYPLGGGQAGDSGWLLLPDGRALAIADARKAGDEQGQPTADKGREEVRQHPPRGAGLCLTMAGRNFADPAGS